MMHMHHFLQFTGINLSLPLRGRLAHSIHREPEKGNSRKPVFIHPLTYTVPGRRKAGLFTGLPRRVLLGNSRHEKSRGC